MDFTIKIRIAIWMTLFFNSVELFAQQSISHFHLQEKYWNYRERFKKNFVEIGEGTNTMIPGLLKFDYLEVNDIAPDHADGACVTNTVGGKFLFGGENPLVHLSTYISILSTEIALLKLNSQKYEAPLLELSFCLLALKRLDENSDVYLDPNLGTNLDGRFMRSDQDEDAYKNWQYYDTTKFVHNEGYRTFRKIRSWGSPPNCAPQTYNYDNIMSKDEIIAVLRALAFVKKYVPNEYVDIGTGQFGLFIVDEAVAIASRIMNYLTQSQAYIQKCGIIGGEVDISQNWVIVYPIVNRTNPDPPNEVIDNRLNRTELKGNDFWPSIAPAVTALGQYITGNWYSHVQITARTGAAWYSFLCRDRTTTTDHLWRYNAVISSLMVDVNTPSSVIYLMGWGYIPWLAFQIEPDNGWISANINLNAGLAGPINTFTAFQIAKNYNITLKHELSYAQFRGVPTLHPKSFFENALQDAPECDFVRRTNMINDTPIVFNSRFFEQKLFGKPSDWDVHWGIRSGMDYMLLYNLFHLQFLSQTEPYFKFACDCEKRSEIYDLPNYEVVQTEQKGETKIHRLPDYLNWGISVESYINKPVSISQNGKLVIRDFVAVCTRINESPTIVNVLGDLEVGDANFEGVLRIGNNGIVKVDNGGKLIVKPSSFVNISRGGLVEVKNGGILVIQNGSRLTVEAGAELRVDAGAQIILAGSDAVLEIEGALQLGNNQYFSIGTQSGQTPGYIRFMPGAQVLAGSGAQMVLGEVNNLRKVLELADNAQIHLPASLAQFSINHGEVQMAPGSRLMVATKAVFVNARFERLGSTGMHQGVLLSGNHAHQITASRFNHGTKGLELNLNGNLHQIALLNNQFNNNLTGLIAFGGRLVLGSGSFTNNNIWGLQLHAPAMATQINNVSFSGNGNGIYVASPSNQPILIQGCSLQRQSQSGVGIQVDNGNVTLRNSNISNYQQAVVGTGQSTSVRLACNNISNCEEGIVAIQDARFVMSSQARNSFSNLQYGITVYDAAIWLQNGHNDFSNQVSQVISGRMSSNCYVLNSSGFTPFYQLPAENNRFELNYTSPSASFQPGTWIEAFEHACLPTFQQNESVLIPVHRMCQQCQIQFISCDKAAPPWWHHAYPAVGMDVDPTAWVVQSPLFPGIELIEAIRLALNEISTDLESPTNDSLALAMFKEILTANYSQLDAYGRSLLETANEAMNFALSNAYLLGILPVNYGNDPEPLHDYVQLLLSSLSDMIAESDDPSLKTKYALDKVLLLRLAGHYADALDELNHSDAVGHINFSYWHCILDLEWRFFKQEIDEQQFALEAGNCMQQFQARRNRPNRNYHPGYTQQQLPGLQVSPNPSQHEAVLRFDAIKKTAVIQITDAQGKLIQRHELAEGNSDLRLQSSQFKPGLYIITLTSPDQPCLRTKWMVSR
jgi:hypothetical protein